MATGAAGDDGAGADAGAVYVFASSSPRAEQGRLTAPDAEAGDKFGASVSIDGNTLAVGAPGDDDLGFESGAVWLYTVTGSLWSMEDKPPASDGETLLVGAFGQDPSGTLSGTAYVFVRTGSSWNQKAKLEPADGTAIDMFGSAVAIDGDTAATASPGDSDGGGMSGSVYVFKRAGTLWTLEAKLTASDAAASDLFGLSIAISGDTIAVGAASNDDTGSASGSAYVFKWTGASWSEEAKLVAADASPADQFGSSVSITGDTIVVGAYTTDDTVEQVGEGAQGDSGSGYVFRRSGTTWTQQSKLTAVDASAGDFFGKAVAVDANIVAIGAKGADAAGDDSGAAYNYNLANASADIVVTGDVSPDPGAVGGVLT